MASFHGRTLRTGAFLRFAAEEYHYEDEYIRYDVGVRGKLRDRARELGDPDVGDFRADNTCGWKARKHRHQWEHRVLAAEKREKKPPQKSGRRLRRRPRPGGRSAPQKRHSRRGRGVKPRRNSQALRSLQSAFFA